MAHHLLGDLVWKALETVVIDGSIGYSSIYGGDLPRFNEPFLDEHTVV